MATKIEWAANGDGSPGRTWNPIAGCQIVSPGCRNCYAMRMAHRLGHNPATPLYAGLTHVVNGRPVWTGEIRTNQAALELPLSIRKPSTWFVNSMSDLFADGVPDATLDQVFAVMALARRHTFQILTKRPQRARQYLSDQPRARRRWEDIIRQFTVRGALTCSPPPVLPNVWLGTSIERQAEADERMPELLATPAAVRFVSAEPLLGPIDLSAWLWEFDPCPGCPCPDPSTSREGIESCCCDPAIAPPRLHWVIAGGESGPGARPMHPAWAREIRDQCDAADVPFFFKQWGEWGLGQHPDHPLRYALDDGTFGELPLFARTEFLSRVGKKAAGRLLDGVTHDARPKIG